MNPRPLGYEPSELPNCSTPRRYYQDTGRPRSRQILAPQPAHVARGSVDQPDGVGGGGVVAGGVEGGVLDGGVVGDDPLGVGVGEAPVSSSARWSRSWDWLIAFA